MEIPDTWDLRELSSVALQVTDGKHGDCVNESGSGFFFISAKDIINGRISYSNARQITKEDFEEVNKRTKFQVNDIVLSNSGSIGKVAIAKDIPETARTTFQKSVAIIKPATDVVSPYYLGQILLHSRKRLEIRATGSSQKNLLLRELRSTKIPIPPIKEQHKIAEILGIWDEAIRLTKELIAAKQQRKKVLMQQLLTGKRRFPEFADQPWRKVHLEDVSTVNSDSLPNGADPDREYFYVELSAVGEGSITLPSHKIPFSELPSRARRILHTDDVIVSTVRPNLLGYALCDFDPADFLCSTGFALLSPNFSGDSQFIYQSLYGNSIQRQVIGLLTGSNYPAINSTDVKRLNLMWPQSHEERSKIGAVLSSCDTEISLLKAKVIALQTQKKGLMQQLLTGKTRVKVD